MNKEEDSTKAASFAGKTEVIWLLTFGIISAAALIASVIEAIPTTLIYPIGFIAGVFALPPALIIIAIILSGILQIFTGRGVPLFAWKGGVDNLSLAEFYKFKSKPRMMRFAKVYLWLFVNSLAGAAIALIAFAGFYMLMQFAQQKH